jgi:hypothetical protein
MSYSARGQHCPVQPWSSWRHRRGLHIPHSRHCTWTVCTSTATWPQNIEARPGASSHWRRVHCRRPRPAAPPPCCAHHERSSCWRRRRARCWRWRCSVQRRSGTPAAHSCGRRGRSEASWRPSVRCLAPRAAQFMLFWAGYRVVTALLGRSPGSGGHRGVTAPPCAGHIQLLPRPVPPVPNPSPRGRGSPRTVAASPRLPAASTFPLIPCPQAPEDRRRMRVQARPLRRCARQPARRCAPSLARPRTCAAT